MKNCYLADKKVTVQLLKKIILIIEQIKKTIEFPYQVFQELYSCYVVKEFLNFLFYGLAFEISQNSKIQENFMRIKHCLL